MTKTLAYFGSIALLVGLFMVACSRSNNVDEEGVANSNTESGTSTANTPPVARIDVVNDSYHEQTVDDPYRWLEDWQDEEVKSWTDGQNDYARKVLGDLQERPAVHARLTEILKSVESATYRALRKVGADALFAVKRDPEKQQAILVRMAVDGDPSHEKIFIDPNHIDAEGGTSIDWYEPSHNGALIAVSMSSGGSESGDVTVYETATGKQVDVVIERVNGGTAGGDLAWFPDDSGFYYTRYPRAGEREDDDMHFYQQVWQHTLGKPAEDDQYVIGETFPRIAEIRLIVDEISGRLLVWVQDGDSNRFELHLRQANGAWNKFSEFGDGVIQAAFGPNNSIYIISLAGAPRGRILKLDATAPILAEAEEVVAQGEGALSHSFYFKFSPSILIAEDRIYATYEIGGPNELRVFSLDGDPQASPVQMDVSTAYGLTPAGGSDVYFGSTSYVAMSKWLHFNA
ncbi:MAG: hypothetical protein OER97_09120, partial [Gammaproteobacteria bacterium]|nr:hypothetical protein [Gammaproteobacteria bacterium]